MTSSRKHHPIDPMDAAIWWATRRQSDPEGFAQDARFNAWILDPDNARAWELQQQRDALVGSFAAEPEIRRMRQDALEFARSARSPGRFRRFAPWAAAACLAVGFAAWLTLEPVTAPPHSASLTDDAERFATLRGERRNVVLADGSRMALNGNTTVEVSYGPARRDIRLLSGQALFHVAKDTGRPFVVAAGDRRITATGTAFDVAIQPHGGVKILLVEGRVEVDPARSAGLSRLLPALDREVLRPGEELIAPTDGPPTVRIADVEQVIAWNRGLIILRDDTVASAVSQLNQATDLQIEIGDRSLGDLKVSGVFPTDRPEDFIAALKEFHPVDASRGRNRVTLRLREDTSSQQ